MTLSDNELTEVSGGNQKAPYIYYTVVSGDTLWGIAQKFKTTIDEICLKNGWETEHRIFPGDKLIVPNNA